MAKLIRNIFKIESFSLDECNDGYYLYDYVQGFNIVMRAKTEQDAYIEALLHYQKSLSKSKEAYKNLSDKVDNFISQFEKDED